MVGARRRCGAEPGVEADQVELRLRHVQDPGGLRLVAGAEGDQRRPARAPGRGPACGSERVARSSGLPRRGAVLPSLGGRRISTDGHVGSESCGATAWSASGRGSTGPSRRRASPPTPCGPGSRRSRPSSRSARRSRRRWRPRPPRPPRTRGCPTSTAPTSRWSRSTRRARWTSTRRCTWPGTGPATSSPTRSPTSAPSSRPGDPVDVEAHTRGQTLYGADSKVPLHPKVLSEDAASLLPDQVRPALLWTIRLDSDGSRTDVEVERALVRSTAKLTYQEAQRVHRRRHGLGVAPAAQGGRAPAADPRGGPRRHLRCRRWSRRCTSRTTGSASSSATCSRSRAGTRRCRC